MGCFVVGTDMSVIYNREILSFKADPEFFDFLMSGDDKNEHRAFAFLLHHIGSQLAQVLPPADPTHPFNEILCLSPIVYLFWM